MFASFRRLTIVILASLCVMEGELLAQSGVVEVAQRAAMQRIQPGDRIDLKFLRDRDLNANVTVNERGEAVFPKLGTIRVSDIAIGALGDTLAHRYKEFIRDAELEVSVLRRVVVNGQVRVP